MKIKKILLVIVSVMFIVGIMAVPASAAESDNDVAEPYAVICDACGGRMVTSYTSWSTWENDYNDAGQLVKRSCGHGYSYGYDYRESRTRTRTDSCQDCPFNVRTYPVQYRYTDCHGYDIN